MEDGGFMGIFNLFSKKTTSKFDNDDFEQLCKVILSNKDLWEKVAMVCSMEFLDEPKLLSENNAEYGVESNLEGTVFAEEGGTAGVYILLQDNTIGYINYAEGECVRVANTLKEALELVLNCAYAWQNYALHYSELTLDAVEKYEVKGEVAFEDAYGLKYKNLKLEIAKSLNLVIYKNVLNDVIDKFYAVSKSEPTFETIVVDSGDKLKTLVY